MISVRSNVKGSLAIGLTVALVAAFSFVGMSEVSAMSYTGGANQFAGGFSPSNAPYGGFGGASSCTVTKTPVVWVHGNGVNAQYLDKPSTSGVPSAYAALKAAGYKDCELFGITWLSSSEQGSSVVQYNYHTSTKAARIRDFINAVKAYTGRTQVDVLGHSMGVSVADHGLTYGGLWGSVRKFVNIAGALRGLSTCYLVGYANALAPTCGSQNIYDSNIFGFWQHGSAFASNPRTGSGTSNSFRDQPARRSAVSFYTIAAGYSDEIHCGTGSNSSCGIQPKYASTTSNVKSQLNVGSSSVGHIPTLTNTGKIQSNMLNTTCTGTGCCSGYSGTCSLF